MAAIGVLVYWNASTDPTITNYIIHCGTSPGSYTLPPLTVGNVLYATYSVPGAGTYYFAISAVSSVTGETANGAEFVVVVIEPAGKIFMMVRRQSVI